MKIFGHMDNARPAFEALNGTSICIGNFDGCHKGHQSLISEVIKISTASNLRTCILTFSPSPKVFFDPSHALKQLFTQDQKERAFSELGVEYLINQPFTKDFSSLRPHEFAEVLVGLRCKKLFVGSDFRFGVKRSGDIQFLKSYTDTFEVMAKEMVAIEGSEISSTKIRGFLEAGELEKAESYLGRPYCLTGEIIKGEQLGRKISFPTANLRSQQMVPRNGVYSGFIELDNETELNINPKKLAPAVFNIGIKPTVSNEGTVSVEGHALEQKWEMGELYGRQAKFHLLKLLRPEMKFASIDELKEQIQRDCQTAIQSITQWESY